MARSALGYRCSGPTVTPSDLTFAHEELFRVGEQGRKLDAEQHKLTGQLNLDKAALDEAERNYLKAGRPGSNASEKEIKALKDAYMSAKTRHAGTEEKLKSVDAKGSKNRYYKYCLELFTKMMDEHSRKMNELFSTMCRAIASGGK